MKLITEIMKIEQKIKNVTKFMLIFCLLLALLSAFILSMYHFTYIIFQYDLGITLLRISIFLSVSAIICALAFNRIKKDLDWNKLIMSY